MADDGADLTHRAYEFALGQGLGTWERSARVTSPRDEQGPRPRRLLGSRAKGPGQLVLHVFEEGFVVERLKGSVRGACCSSVVADLIDIGAGDRVALRLTFETGDAVLLVEPTGRDCPALSLVASRCRSSTPAPVPYPEAVAAMSGSPWI